MLWYICYFCLGSFNHFLYHLDYYCLVADGYFILNFPQIKAYSILSGDRILLEKKSLSDYK